MKFPQTKASNLLRQQINLPADFQGELNILLIQFQQWHQSQVDTWIPFLQQLERSTPSISFYDLPTIQRIGILSQTFINEGMRVGISNRLSRERKVTLYEVKVEFRQALDLVGEEDISIVVSDRQRYIYWKAQGVFNPEKAKTLVDLIKNHIPEESLASY